MARPYKRRKSASFIRNFWMHRWLILAAIILGTLLWFILINNQEVTVHLPFGLGKPTASVGLVVLFSAGAGSVVSGVLTALFLTVRRHRHTSSEEAEPIAADLPEDRPPPDYAARTPEGFSDAPWSAR